MAKHSEQLLTGLLGLSEQSSRKSHYPELLEQLKQLERERNRYKWLFEHANYGVFQAFAGGGFRAANPAMLALLGYDSVDQLLAEDDQIGERVFVGGRSELDRINSMLMSRGSLLGYETRMRTRDGADIDVLINIFLNTDERGLVEGFVANITERKRAQLRLLQLNQELEQRVNERTAALHDSNLHLQQQVRQREQVEQALREARDAAEAANRSKDKYLAAASHDLLQPLNAARLLISTLQERPLLGEDRHLVQRAHLALEGAEDLLKDLLDIARLDQDAVTAEIGTCSLAALYESLLSEFEPVARQSGLRLDAFISRLHVRADCHLLMRIMRNFVSNACRYTRQGRILLGVRKEGQRVRLEVWDTGVGLSPEQLGAAFQEFRQFGKVQNGVRKGVGLGLAIVERIAGLMEARIQVRSRPGRGSCFSVELPLAQAPQQVASPVAAVSSPALNPLQGRRILVVDNEPDILLSMAALLGQWECEVVVAATLDEAILALDALPPDIILADLHLDDGCNGLEVVAGLRRYFAAEIPAVLVTADQADEQAQLRQQLKVPVLNKSVRPSKLRAILSQRLSSF
ncbi:MAG: response regulator [Gammaproteobacteria bacterium]|nr:response regulator [Gammaproteobacteria bacterium]